MGEEKEQKYKQWSTKHNEENLRSSSTNPNKNRVNLSALETHKPSDKSKTRKESANVTYP